MNRSIFLIITLICLGCKAGFKVNSEEIRPTNYTKSRSFKFVNPSSIPKANFSFSPNNQKIIFDAIANELKARGFQSHQNAKYLVKVQGGTETEEQTRTANSYRNDPYRYNWHYPYNRTIIRDDISRKRSTLIIEILDSESRKLLWHGVASGEMGDQSEEVESSIKEAVHEIFLSSPLPQPESQADNISSE